MELITETEVTGSSHPNREEEWVDAWLLIIHSKTLQKK